MKGVFKGDVNPGGMRVLVTHRVIRKPLDSTNKEVLLWVLLLTMLRYFAVISVIHNRVFESTNTFFVVV